MLGAYCQCAPSIYFYHFSQCTTSSKRRTARWVRIASETSILLVPLEKSLFVVVRLLFRALRYNHNASFLYFTPSCPVRYCPLVR
jgi:hypothetical protein